MSDDRIKAMFTESKTVSFETIPTVLLVGVVYLEPGTMINDELVFRNVPIYEIPGYQRGKNKKVKVPFPGVPYVVLSAKYGSEVRGIVKDTRVKTEKKGKFPNGVFLDIAISDRVLNVTIFKDSIKVTGAITLNHLLEAFIFVKSLLNYLQGFYTQGLLQQPIFQKPIVVVSFSKSMENVVFNLGFKIDKEVLREKAVEAGALSPPEMSKDAVRVLYPMEKGKSKGGDRYYNFRVMHTGKVVFSGDDRKNMEAKYYQFMDFVRQNEDAIRYD
jgi:hypothetical protein